MDVQVARPGPRPRPADDGDLRPDDVPGEPSSTRGQVVRDPRDDRFLRYEDGTPYYPMGHNVAFRRASLSTRRRATIRAAFASMDAAGQNWTRIWMTDFYRNAFEWSADIGPAGIQGLGSTPAIGISYRTPLDVAEEYGLQVQLVLNDHGQVAAWWTGDGKKTLQRRERRTGPCRPSRGILHGSRRKGSVQAASSLPRRPLHSYRNLLAWELFNEVQFVGSDNANPYYSAQVRDDIVAWHAEMAAYLRSIDPYQHLITTSSDIESSLKDIWADPNIDLVQVHDYDPELATRDTRFRDYVMSLNAAYDKPVIIGEFGIAGIPENEFDPVTARLSTTACSTWWKRPTSTTPPGRRRCPAQARCRGGGAPTSTRHPTTIGRRPTSRPTNGSTPRSATSSQAKTSPEWASRRRTSRHLRPSSRWAWTTTHVALRGFETPKTSTARALARAMSLVARSACIPSPALLMAPIVSRSTIPGVWHRWMPQAWQPPLTAHSRSRCHRSSATSP